MDKIMGVYLQTITDMRDSIETGSIYIEFDDKRTIVTHINKMDKTFFSYLTTLMVDNVHITKMYFKTYNTADNTSVGFWVDILKMQASGYTINELRLNELVLNSYVNRNIYPVDIANIGSSTCVGSDGKLYTCKPYDGVDIHNKVSIPLTLLSSKSLNIELEQVDMTRPNMVNQLHLKNDISIRSLDANTVSKLKGCLVWIGGLFVEQVPHTSGFYIKDGKAYVNTRVTEYSSTKIPEKGGTLQATLQPDSDDGIYHYDMDIAIFKWDNVDVVWESPTLSDYSSYIYNNSVTHVSLDIDYVDKMYFKDTINEENHILICNGVVYPRELYTIEGNCIVFKAGRENVHSVISKLLEEYPDNTPGFKYLVEDALTTGVDFRIIHFKSDKFDVKVGLDNRCYVNYPYSFHITFKEINVGDVVLIDGVFERYLMYSRNSIRYPLTDHLARFNDKNLLFNSKVNRLDVFYSK